MIVAFRVDAGNEIGAGHLMRCMVLAAALRDRGDSVTLISRRMPGDMISLARSHSFNVVELPQWGDSEASADTGIDSVWQRDVFETAAVLRHLQPNLLVVDHYQLDVRWERAMAPLAQRLMVIDDLAERSHECDILLDPNLRIGSHRADAMRVPQGCIQLVGPDFALVRPEFAAHRNQAISRRKCITLDRLLISMGGSDPSDETGRAVAALHAANRHWKHIDVVVGAAYKHTARLQKLMHKLPAQLHVQTSDMARLMISADFAITASGSTSWEKCVVGLPSIAVIAADNQYPIAEALQSLGAHVAIDARALPAAGYSQILDTITPSRAIAMSEGAFQICDGLGAARVALQVASGVMA